MHCVTAFHVAEILLETIGLFALVVAAGYASHFGINWLASR